MRLIRESPYVPGPLRTFLYPGIPEFEISHIRRGTLVEDYRLSQKQVKIFLENHEKSEFLFTLIMRCSAGHLVGDFSPSHFDGVNVEELVGFFDFANKGEPRF